MKKQLILFCAFFMCMLFSGCGSAPKTITQNLPRVELVNTDTPVAPVVVAFDDIKNVIWQLIEVRVGMGSIVLDRELMAASQMGDYFTLQFAAEGVNGRAAPNRYFAPYAQLDGKDIKIRPVAGTLIDSIVNIGGLTERRFYDILQTVTRWDYKDTILHLYAPGEKDGEEIYMVFRRQ